MDNLVSGSIIEPRITPNPLPPTGSGKRNITQTIIIAIGAVIVLGIIIGMIFLVNSQKNETSEAEEEGWLEDEGYFYQPNDDEALALMYVYSLTNNSDIKIKKMPATFCETLKNIYNKSANDDDPMEASLCNNNQIMLLPASSNDDDLASIGEIYLGVVANGITYNYHIASDFSYISYTSKTNEDTTSAVIINVENY